MILQDLLTPFNETAFTLASAPVSWAELLGFVTGIAAVWLAATQRIANFPVGIANAVFFAILFLDARLYADMALQFAFLVLMVFGWWAWLRRGPGGTELPVQRARPAELAAVLAGVAALTVVLVPVLRAAHGTAPFLDALTTAMSIGAQLLLSLKRLQNWYIWIAADLIYIPLFASRGLYLTAIVYVVFLGICVRALRDWRRELAAAEAAGVTAAAPAPPLPAQVAA